MSTTYSTSLRLAIMGTGDQSGTWGNTTNTNLGTLLEQSISGVRPISLTGLTTYTLQAYNGTIDDARSMVLVFTGSPSAGVTIVSPLVNKMYIVVNLCGQTITMSATGGSTTLAIPYGSSGTTAQCYCDAANATGAGAGFYSAQTGSAGNFNINGNLSVTGNSTDVGNLSAAGVLGAYTAASFTGGISGTTLTVSAIASGVIFPGQRISGTGVTSGTEIISGSGTTWTVNISQTVSGGTTFTGAAGVTAPTMPSGDNSVNVATTAFVQNTVTPVGVPTGTINMWSVSSPPSGYLICNGQGVSTSTYSTLFGVIGYTFGGSSGTFLLPNYSGAMPIGATSGSTSTFTGSISGTTLTVSALGTGTIGVNQVLSGGSVASGTTITGFVSGTFGGVGVYTVSVTQTLSSTSLTGTLSAIALASTGGAATTALTSSAQLPSHVHSITDTTHNHSNNFPTTWASGDSGGIGFFSGATRGSVSYGTNAAYTGITGTNSTGSSTAFSTISPYLGIYFIIKT